MQRFKRKTGLRTEMAEDKLKKKYEVLASKHCLPTYDILDKEFNLDAIDTETHILRNVAKQIANKHEHYANVIENIIHPDQTLTAMHESQSFSDVERTQYVFLLRKLMKVYRTYTLLDLQKEEFETFIKDSWIAWPGLKEELHGVLARLADAWQKNEELKVEIEYLG